MTLDEFYEEMKNALRFFGLHFGEKEEVQISAENGAITLAHGNKTITISVVDKE